MLTTPLSGNDVRDRLKHAIRYPLSASLSEPNFSGNRIVAIGPSTTLCISAVGSAPLGARQSNSRRQTNRKPCCEPLTHARVHFGEMFLSCKSNARMFKTEFRLRHCAQRCPARLVERTEAPGGSTGRAPRRRTIADKMHGGDAASEPHRRGAQRIYRGQIPDGAPMCSCGLAQTIVPKISRRVRETPSLPLPIRAQSEALPCKGALAIHRHVLSTFEHMSAPQSPTICFVLISSSCTTTRRL